MKAGEISALIESVAPLHIQEGWDNSGYSIGGPRCDVHKAIVALDCTLEVVDRAMDMGADMIITHHPLIFGSLKCISDDTYTGSVIMKAVKNGLVVYCCHTTMDKVPCGVSGLMAERLKLKDVSILDCDSEGCGLGIIGTLPEPMDARDFVAMVKECFGLQALRSSSLPKKKISRVAACGGSGGSLIEKGADAGADAFITGDVSYHHFFCSPDYLVIDIGHYESECDIVGFICDLIKEKIPTFAACPMERGTNPVRYH